MDAVVMAAGEGRRLRPLTNVWAKPLLPIDGRPVVATLLRELRAAAFDSVTLVVGHLGEQLERFVGDGSGFGLTVRYAWQPEPVGSADAVARGLDAGARPPVLAAGADTVFAPGAIARFVEAWTASAADGALAVRHVPPQELSERSSVRAEGGRLLDVVEKPPADTAAGTLAGAPLWVLGPAVCAYLDDLPGPPFELAVAAQRAIDDGKAIAAVDVGPTRDITRPEDVVARNFAYLWSEGPR